MLSRNVFFCYDERMKNVAYPYMSKDGEFIYVPASDPYIRLAKSLAFLESLDAVMPNASVLVKCDAVIGFGANGSEYHKTHECERQKRNIPTGQGYELCEGCHPKNHSEQKAVRDAQNKGNDASGAVLYLWGHWWCCEPCWAALIGAGVKRVCLLGGSEKFFNKGNPENIIGHQFDERLYQIIHVR